MQQFVRGNAEKLTLDLFFDTTEHGMGPSAVSVTTETDKIYQLIKIDPEQHAPPILTFLWNDKFPGSSIGAPPKKRAGGSDKVVTSVPEGEPSALDTAVSATGSSGATALDSAGHSSAKQRVNGFRCIIEFIKQNFTLFSSEGVPLRATLTVSLREYRTLNDQLKQLSLEFARSHSRARPFADRFARQRSRSAITTGQAIGAPSPTIMRSATRGG